MGGDKITFDDFEDGTIDHLMWTEQPGNGSISESGGVLTLSGAQGVNCRLWASANYAPLVRTGIPAYPCEIITRLNPFTVNNGVFASVFVGFAMGEGVPWGALFGHKKTAGGGQEGLIVHVINGTGAAYAYDIVPVTTLPVWLKITMTAGNTRRNRIRFWYMTEESGWVEYIEVGSQSLIDYYSISYGDFMAGLACQNSTAPDDSAFAAPFEFFEIQGYRGPC